MPVGDIVGVGVFVVVDVPVGGTVGVNVFVGGTVFVGCFVSVGAINLGVGVGD